MNWILAQVTDLRQLRGRQGGTPGLLSNSVYYKGTIEVPLGEEGLREITITLIVKTPDTRLQVQTFWTASDVFLLNPGDDVIRYAC